MAAIGLGLALLLMPWFSKYYIVLAPLLALWASWRYVARGSETRLALLAGAVALAGLFRVDFGAYAGMAALLAIVSAPLPWSRRLATLGRAVVYGLLWLTPWFGWLAWRGALGAYLHDAVLIAPGHAQAMSLPFMLPGVNHPVRPAAIGQFVSFAIAYAAPPLVLWRLWRGAGASSEERRRMLCAVGLAQMTLIHAAHRSDYQHLLQTLPPTLVLYAWLAGATLPAASRVRRRVAVGLAMAAVGLAGVIMSGAPRLSLAAAADAWRLHRLPRGAMITALTTTNPDDAWAQLIAYVRHCTQAEDRLVVLQPFVGLYYFSNRRFAGTLPTWSPGFFSDAAHQREWVAREQAQPARLLIGDEAFTFDDRPARRFATYAPLIAAHLRETFAPVGSIGPLWVRARRPTAETAAAGPPPCPLPS